MKDLSPKFGTIRVVGCLCISTVALMCSLRGNENERLVCSFGRQGDEITITVTNQSLETIAFYNPFKSKIPSLTQIKVMDAGGNLLTENDVSKEGYWTPLFLESSLMRTPVDLQDLPPEESLIAKFSLGAMTTGLRNGFDPNEARKVKVRVVICLNPNLTERLIFESEWLLPDTENSRSATMLRESRKPGPLTR
jgi:hypothetical protein